MLRRSFFGAFRKVVRHVFLIGLLHNGKLIAEGTLGERRALSGEERLSNVFLKIVSAEDLRAGSER